MTEEVGSQRIQCCSVEGNRTKHIVSCRNRKYVKEAQPYTSWVTGHTKITQKYNFRCCKTFVGIVTNNCHGRKRLTGRISQTLHRLTK